MKKITVFTILVLVVISSIFSFDFGGGIGVGVLIGNPNGFSGGLYEAFEMKSGVESDKNGLMNVQFLLGYKNFVVGLGMKDFVKSNNTNTTTPTDNNSTDTTELTISLGYNINLNTLVTPSIFVEYGVNGTLSVSVVAMFNWYPHRHDYSVIDHKDPDCTEFGYTTSKCSKCGKIHTEAIEPTHDLELVSIDTGDCTHMGHISYKCKKCDYSNTIFTEPKHNFYWESSSVWIDYYKERCRDCGKYSGRIKDHGRIYEL